MLPPGLPACYLPHVLLQTLPLTDDLIQASKNPAALLPAGHTLGAAEPTPLFR